MSTSETITRTDLTNILNTLGTGVPYEDTGTKSLSYGIKYRRKNGFVFVDCYCAGDITLNTNYQTLATLPEGYRPNDTLYVPMGSNGSSVGVAFVTSAGAIGAKTFSGTATYFWFHFSYPVATNAYFDEKVDYIVEQGTSGIWTYRKWNSGIAECWGVDSRSRAMTTSYGNSYYADLVQVSFPTNLFIDTPTVTASRSNSGTTQGLVTVSVGADSAKVFGYVYSSTSLTTTVGVAFHAHGRWK